MASDQQPSLGEKIRRARERLHMNQTELAAAVGASQRAVGDWENDRRKPRNRLGALEEILGVTLTGSEDERAESYTDPVELSIWEDESLPEHERRDLIGQLRERRRAHSRRIEPV